jgi:hypothetical protein
MCVSLSRGSTCSSLNLKARRFEEEQGIETRHLVPTRRSSLSPYLLHHNRFATSVSEGFSSQIEGGAVPSFHSRAGWDRHDGGLRSVESSGVEQQAGWPRSLGATYLGCGRPREEMESCPCEMIMSWI